MARKNVFVSMGFPYTESIEGSWTRLSNYFAHAMLNHVL